MCRLKIILVLILVFCFTGTAFAETHAGIMVKDRLFVPLRGVLQELGFKVNWDGDSKTASIESDVKHISLQVGNNKANISDNTVQLQNSPVIKQGRVYVPLRFCVTALGAKVNWEASTKQALIKYSGKTIKVIPTGVNNQQSGKIKHYTRKVESKYANIIEISPGTATADVILGQNRVGCVEDLASMAKRSGAVVAINGTFFEAYEGKPVPWGTLIKNGKVIHIENMGTTAGITTNGRVKLAPLRISIDGVIDSGEHESYWYAYGVNRTPGETGVYIYTPEWGNRIGFNKGISVIISHGEVISIQKGNDANIPHNGFVINFTGAEKHLASRFNVGDKVTYKVIYNNTFNSQWADVTTGVGAGPRLVANGLISVNTTAEGFTSPKILEMAGARSAIGVKQDGTIILATVSSATIKELANIMKRLGAYNAMNLDGGASSGLWFKGKYITKPGRKLSNALIFK